MPLPKTNEVISDFKIPTYDFDKVLKQFDEVLFKCDEGKISEKNVVSLLSQGIVHYKIKPKTIIGIGGLNAMLVKEVMSEADKSKVGKDIRFRFYKDLAELMVGEF